MSDWEDPKPWLSETGQRAPEPYAETPESGWTWTKEPRTKDRYDLEEALDVLAHIVSQANVNPVVAEDAAGEFISRYDMPVGSIHKAIPFLARHGIVVDRYGYVHRRPQ